MTVIKPGVIEVRKPTIYFIFYFVAVITLMLLFIFGLFESSKRTYLFFDVNQIDRETKFASYIIFGVCILIILAIIYFFIIHSGYYLIFGERYLFNRHTGTIFKNGLIVANFREVTGVYISEFSDTEGLDYYSIEILLNENEKLHIATSSDIKSINDIARRISVLVDVSLKNSKTDRARNVFRKERSKMFDRLR